MIGLALARRQPRPCNHVHPFRFLAEVGRALTHTHGTDIMHNDLKASNVLLVHEEPLVTKVLTSDFLG